MAQGKYQSVSNFAELANRTDVYIRKLCRENKLDYMQERSEHNKKMTYKINMDGDKTILFMNKIKAKNDISSETNSETSNDTQGSYVETSSETFEGSVEPSNDTLIETLERFESYIYKAGQLLAIEDKNKNQADRIVFLEGEVSRLMQEVTKLEKTVTKLETEKKFSDNSYRQIALELESEKKKPFWKRNVI